jgi:diguanylate cyclase (GGDEF)-like protein
MASIFGSYGSRSELDLSDGSGNTMMRQAASAPLYLQQLSRREWWLWFSASVVTLLSSVAFLLTFFSSFFRHSEHFYELRTDQARWATLSLVLLFNVWLIYRQWSFRRMRRQADGASFDAQSASQALEPPSLDPVTGLHNRASFEQQLAKEIARARRINTPLSLATLHVDDLGDITGRLGKSAVDAALKELARYLKKASRGSDIAARMSNDDFLLLLPECGVTEVKQVFNRIPSVEVTASGKRIPLTYTTGWVDYQPGDQPAQLLKRAADLLHLYDTAASSSVPVSLR